MSPIMLLVNSLSLTSPSAGVRRGSRPKAWVAVYLRLVFGWTWTPAESAFRESQRSLRSTTDPVNPACTKYPVVGRISERSSCGLLKHVLTGHLRICASPVPKDLATDSRTSDQYDQYLSVHTQKTYDVTYLICYTKFGQKYALWIICW